MKYINIAGFILSIGSLIVSGLALFFNITRSNKKQRLEYIDKIGKPFLIECFPGNLFELQLSIDKIKIKTAVDTLGKEKEKIAFLKFYDYDIYGKANAIFQELEELIYNLVDQNDPHEEHKQIEKLTKELINIIYK